jgi:hypothetical protein
LFWKSLPLSDTATVLSKLFVGVIVIPLVYFVAADIATLLMALVVSVRARGHRFGSMSVASRALAAAASAVAVRDRHHRHLVPARHRLAAADIRVGQARASCCGHSAAARPVCSPSAGSSALMFVPQCSEIGSSAGIRAKRSIIALELGDACDKTRDHHAGSIWRCRSRQGFFSSPQTWIGVLVGAALIVGAIQLRKRRTETLARLGFAPECKIAPVRAVSQGALNVQDEDRPLGEDCAAMSSSS